MDSKGRLPDVIFIGPLKTATSYIYDYYLHHPNVTTSEPVKELYYYDDHYHQGEEWYLKHFSPQPEHQCMIDVSPSYLIDDDALGRIKKDNPTAFNDSRMFFEQVTESRIGIAMTDMVLYVRP